MRKEGEGRFHTSKKHPSGSEINKGIVTLPKEMTKSIEQTNVEEKYNITPESVHPEGVRLLHPNRITQKNSGQKSKSHSSGKFIHKSIRNSFDTIDTSSFPDELTFTKPQELLQQLSQTSGDCISIYHPMVTSGGGGAIKEETGVTLFKNLIQEAHDRYALDKELFLKLGGLLNNAEFWQSVSSRGLGIYFSKDVFKYINLPEPPASSLHVGRSFNIIPIVPYLSPSPSFFLLVIAKDGVKVFKGDKYGMNQLKIYGMPDGMKDVIHFEGKGNHKLFRTESNGAGRGANYHGMGAGKPDEKKNIEIYLAEVDKSLWSELLHEECAPMLIAGVYYLATMYRKVSRYKNVLNSVIAGNSIHENENELHRHACELLERYFEEDTIKALAKYYHLSGTSLTTDDPQQIIIAGYDARIETLLLPMNKHLWGKYNTKTRRLFIHDERKNDSEELLNAVALKTLTTGGVVHVLNEDHNAPGPMAVLRY